MYIQCISLASQQEVISQPMDVTHIQPTPGLQLVTASGEQLKIVDYIKAPVTLGKLTTKYHDFVVVNMSRQYPQIIKL